MSMELGGDLECCRILCRNEVPTCNSCIKRVDRPGIICDRAPDCHVCMDGVTTERSFDSQAMRDIDVLGLYFGV